MENPPEDIDTRHLLESVYKHSGYDFRDYAPTTLRLRILEMMVAEKITTISTLQDRVLQDRACINRLVNKLTVNVTRMFRNPDFYRTFRAEILPLLRTWPFIRIWHAGCSTGEEVYSMAIVMHEEGLYDRCRFYATDIDEASLKKAESAIFMVSAMQEYTHNYLKAGGKEDFSSYYTASHDHAILSRSLKKNITFAQHNLVTDGKFNEFQVIICRNVLIYFNRPLQERVHRLFHDSLSLMGILGLGNSEAL